MHSYEHGGNIYNAGGIKADFSININPLGMPLAAREAIGANLEQDEVYPDPFCTGLTAAIAEKTGIKPDNILTGNGASDLIMRICACLKPKRVLLTAPAFTEYARSAALFGANIFEYALSERNGFRVDDGFALEALNDYDIVFLCNPNNPTGLLCEEAVIERVIDSCEKSGAYLVMDECFLDFTEAGSAVKHMGAHDRLLILRAP